MNSELDEEQRQFQNKNDLRSKGQCKKRKKWN